jgi:hypothetical protein
MTETNFFIAIHTPISDISIKPYKMIQRLRGFIETVTKNYNQDGDACYEEKEVDGKVIPQVVFMFKFYNEQEYIKVNELLKNLHKVF